MATKTTRRAKESERKREARASSRVVSDPPKPSRAATLRRRRCADSLRLFCLEYLPAKFFLNFSPDHLRVITRLEQVIREGGQFAVAMPRGSGKTELVKAGALWAILYGYRRCVGIVGATSGLANLIMDDLKSTLERNDELYASFPEAIHCVRDLGGIVHRAKVQTWEDGEPTGLIWKSGRVRLPFVKKAKCSGAFIGTAGLTGAIRGLTSTGPDGETIRPDLVLCDDPQTRKSAFSLTQTDTRERIIRGDVMGLAGPKKRIAVLMPCTVIAENDLADRHLDRQKNPQWNGERTRLVEAFPVNTAPWDEYFDLRENEQRAGGTGKAANAFYIANRAAMDAGAILPWPERFDADNFASAIEEAMVKRREDPEAFAAEMQNQPIKAEESLGPVRELDPKDLCGQLNAVPRGIVPRDCTRLTGMIDVGEKILWWCLVGWNEKFGGGVVDYGTFPPQNRMYFKRDDPRPALADVFPKGLNEDQLIHAGLKAVTNQILGRTYQRAEVGEAVAVDRCLIDSHWKPDVVHGFCRQSLHRAVLLPSIGYSTVNLTKTIAEWPVREGEIGGRDHWRISAPAAGRGRKVTFDPDVWKSFVADRLSTPAGGGGCLQLFGDDAKAHELFADHVTGEKSFRKTAKGRTFDQWEKKPARDSDFLDTLVGCAVAASILGVSWAAGAASGDANPPKKKRQPLDLLAEFHKRIAEGSAA